MTQDGATQQPGTDNGHWNWGCWEITVDLAGRTISANPMRSAQLHFNVVPLLKDGTPQSLLGFSNLLVDGSNHTLQVDISLTHPFPTLHQVPGFDVRGILFTLGDTVQLQGGGIAAAGPNEPRLVNADGYTRWWNPTEFPGPELLGYVDGAYGTPHWVASYDLNLAGYKYFADVLGPTDSLNKLNASNRGVFRPGSKNERRYLIDFGDSSSQYLKFNYAVDACWGKSPYYDPDGPALVAPDDFALTSNCPEPYRLRVTESSNTLTATTAGGTNGAVALNIDVFDWQSLNPLSTVPTEISTVQVECPALGLAPQLATVVAGSGVGSNMSTYVVNLVGSTIDKLSSVDFYVSATVGASDYQNDLTDYQGSDPLQAFFMYTAKVQDMDSYSGWTYRYSKLLFDEYPNQGGNLPDIAIYKKSGIVRAVMVDQANPDPNHEGNHHPDSINEWADDYTSYSVPEQYHLPLGSLSVSGRWDDIRGISINDNGTQFFFSNSNIFDEFTTTGFDPLFCYLTRSSHEYLGNAEAADWLSVFFSAGDYPRYWCTDPCNGVTGATDYMYSVWIYDTTGMAGGDPGADPGRYIIFRWQPPFSQAASDADWQRPNNTAPAGNGTGYVDRAKPYDMRLAVDDSAGLTRFYMLDSNREVEVVDCNFALDEFSGYYPRGTVTIPNLPPEVTAILDLEVVNTKLLGTARNYVAALCLTDSFHWRVWVFDYDYSLPLDTQATTIWLSDEYGGEPCSLDACDNPVEAHVLHRNGDLIYVTVFRDYP
jgi:hypothetical protein